MGGDGGVLLSPLVFLSFGLSFSLRGEGGDSPPPAPTPPVGSSLILCFFTLSDQDLSLTCTSLTGNGPPSRLCSWEGDGDMEIGAIRVSNLVFRAKIGEWTGRLRLCEAISPLAAAVAVLFSPLAILVLDFLVVWLLFCCCRVLRLSMEEARAFLARERAGTLSLAELSSSPPPAPKERWVWLSCCL